jgi:hypothetical protein
MSLPSTKYEIIDLWQKKSLGVFTDKYVIESIKPDEHVAFKLNPVATSTDFIQQ